MRHGGGRNAGAREAHESTESFRPRRKVTDIADDEGRRDDASNQKTLLHGQTQPRRWRVQRSSALEPEDLERGLAKTFPLCRVGGKDVNQGSWRGTGDPGRSFPLAWGFAPAVTPARLVRVFIRGGFRALGAAAGGRALLQTTGLAGTGLGTGRLRNRESEAQEKNQSLSEKPHVSGLEDRAMAYRMSTFESFLATGRETDVTQAQRIGDDGDR